MCPRAAPDESGCVPCKPSRRGKHESYHQVMARLGENRYIHQTLPSVERGGVLLLIGAQGAGLSLGMGRICHRTSHNHLIIWRIGEHIYYKGIAF
jgi:hypothetical protein